MQKHTNGYRYRNYKKWETLLNQPYDYINNGLLYRLLSNDITKTKNPVTRFILTYYEKTIIFIMQYIDILKNFKNYNWKNR